MFARPVHVDADPAIPVAVLVDGSVPHTAIPKSPAVAGVVDAVTCVVEAVPDPIAMTPGVPSSVIEPGSSMQWIVYPADEPSGTEIDDSVPAADAL